MNIQEAYKNLDLARGLGKDRVESQYNSLKNELVSKIHVTQNDKLIQVYKSRLEEVEYAYSILLAHFESDNLNKESIQSTIIPPNPTPIQSIPVSSIEIHPKAKKNKSFIIMGIIGLLLVVGISVFYFMTKGNGDIFRVIEGEKRVFVNNLTLRQFPDSESSKIEIFPFGTRLILDEKELPKTDDKNTVWQKVRVIHPVYGWERPDDRFPYPYEGWMAIKECGVNWIEDSVKTNKLSKIIIGNDAGRSISSDYRHELLNYFERNNYIDEWQLLGKSKTEEFQYSLLINLENIGYDCNQKSFNHFIAIFNNKSSNLNKLIIMSIDNFHQPKVIFDKNYTKSETVNYGMRKYNKQELINFNNYMYYQGLQSVNNAIYLTIGESPFSISINRGEVKTWGDENY